MPQAQALPGGCKLVRTTLGSVPTPSISLRRTVAGGGFPDPEPLSGSQSPEWPPGAR